MTTIFNEQKVLDALTSEDYDTKIRACQFCAGQEQLTEAITTQLRKLQNDGNMYVRHSADIALTDRK